MTQCLVDFFKKQDVEYKRNLNISRLSSIGIGGNADFAAMPSDEEKLIKTIEFLKKNRIKHRVVGRLTNILFTSREYNGVLILTSKMKNYYVAENEISAQCGVSFSKMLSELSYRGISICEELYGIPGSIGGMIFGNAGAFGKSISDCLISARLYFTEEKKIVTLTADEMRFSYRNSIMKDKESVLLSASFNFRESDNDALKNRMREIMDLRKSTQPYGAKSLGSVFKRCGDIPISKLIDELGFKGYSVGGACVSEKHAGFIINSGGATAEDVIALISLIKSRIRSSYGIAPEEEIQYIGG